MRQPTLKVQIVKAWAIDPNSGEGHGLLGVFFFEWRPHLPLWMDGNRTAYFRTRRAARQWVADYKDVGVYRSFPNMRVVRVEITTIIIH